MLTCPYCGTTHRKDGRVFEKQGQLNLHMYHCKMKQLQIEEEEEETEVECEHEWRFLNLRQPIEKRAYLGGYKEVCTKCQELK